MSFWPRKISCFSSRGICSASFFASAAVVVLLVSAAAARSVISFSSTACFWASASTYLLSRKNATSSLTFSLSPAISFAFHGSSPALAWLCLSERLHRIELALVVGHGAIAARRLASGFGLQFARGGRFALFSRCFLAE